MFPFFEPANLIMTYLLATVAIAARYGRGPSVVASVVSVAAFDFFFVPPYFTFGVADTQYLLTFTVMLVVGLVISGLTARIRRQAEAARQREQRTAALYAMSRELAATGDVDALIAIAARHLTEVFGAEVAVLLPDAEGTLEVRRTEGRPALEENELTLSRWAFEHGQTAGLGAARSNGARAVHVPLLGPRGPIGVVSVRPPERLNRLVQNLLEMTRLESGALGLSRDWHPLEEVVGAALARLARGLASRRVAVNVPAELPLVAMDDVLIEQVLVNLLDNAVKYTPPDRPIRIIASATDRAVTVEVADRGPGLRPGEEDKVFEKFYRGHPAGGRGAGLGLTICQGIVRAHGGRIWAQNLPEGGVSFLFTLPLGEKPPASVPADA